MTMFLLEAVYSVVVQAQLFKLINVAFLFACVNLASFLNDGDQLLFNFIYSFSVVEIKSFIADLSINMALIKSST